jgi:MFS family permease
MPYDCQDSFNVMTAVFSTMVGGVISDIYKTEERNTPMALFSGSVLVGTALGPLVSGFIAQNTSWRWIFYVQLISCGICTLTIILFFQETRGSVLLSRKAEMLNRWYEVREQRGYFMSVLSSEEAQSGTIHQRIRWKVKSDEDRRNIYSMIIISMYRPFRVLSPIICHEADKTKLTKL